jgi:hypothetical protein
MQIKITVDGFLSKNRLGCEKQGGIQEKKEQHHHSKKKEEKNRRKYRK